jgi:porphobilinogen synthase
MLERPRRNRSSEAIRSMVRETRLDLANLVFPLFVVDGKGKKDPIGALPGISRFSEDLVIKEVEECMNLGLKSFVLFPALEDSLKDKAATYSYSDKNFYLRIISRIKKEFPESCLVSDVAMDPYSSDGHDGLVVDGKIMNDETLGILGKMAVAQAESGIDIIGPSDMMDGRVQHLREELDDEGFEDVAIMSYCAKYASAYYGPFREALESEPKTGDKKTYQMDPSNKWEALREAELDFAEGADFLMVKPAILYLDVIHLLKEKFEIPIAAYNVSGEYAMLKAASANGWLNYNQAMPEMLLSIKRAGASAILTYFAKEYAQMLKEGSLA